MIILAKLTYSLIFNINKDPPIKTIIEPNTIINLSLNFIDKNPEINLLTVIPI